MTTRSRLIAASLASAAAVLLGVLAAWPIYRDPWLLVPAAVALAAGVGVAALAARRRWPGPAAALALFVVFALTVVPVAVPQSLRPFPLAPLRGIADGVAAVVLGWKQLLTLTLPVGTYQTMLVPAYLVLLLTVFLTTWIALRAGRFAPFAAFPLLAPVAFGTVFGSSAVSAPLHLGPFTISAPHELALWAGAALLGAVWVVATAGAGRRAALRLGRAESATASRGRAVRVLVGVVTLAIAVAVSLALAPALDRGARAVPRDRIDPELVIREQASPLAGYRAYKRDALFEEELFAVDAGAEPPGDCGSPCSTRTTGSTSTSVPMRPAGSPASRAETGSNGRRRWPCGSGRGTRASGRRPPSWAACPCSTGRGRPNSPMPST
ncbi:hypothetical protein [Leucobacter soli]|uniref:hypothetical protein n=1 Tax=Leucobacter soli TaxID=2812850 RepID=UPI0036073846